MKRVDFEKLMKDKKPNEVIGKHVRGEIYLTNKQLDEVIDAREKGKYTPRKTQADRVLDYIKQFGSITTLEAFNDLGVTRLSAVIFELKDRNIEIDSTTETRKNRYGEKCSYSRYFLKERGF